jgi:hypothetical protein
MPQDSGAEPNGEAEIAAAAKRMLEQAATEPIPDKIVQLAERLEDALAKKRTPSSDPKRLR